MDLINGGAETLLLRMKRLIKMLKVDSLFKSYGALLATDNLSFQVKKGDIHAILGPNGAGKTTLIG